MILNSDFILHHPLWAKADEELCNPGALGLFNRLVDVFILACSIGIKEDCMVTNIDNPLQNSKSISRSTYMSPSNLDLSDSLNFMLQNVLINTKHLSLSTDERLKLAFDPDYTLPKISATSLLIGFANYGIEKIFENIHSKSSLIAMNQLHKYFESLTDSNYDDILKTITLEDLRS